MVWSKDLAKLKQDLKELEGSGPPAPATQPVKPAAPPEAPKSLEEEDALFLSIVGKAIAVVPKGHEVSEGSDEFGEAMLQLKGFKQKKTDIPSAVEPQTAPFKQFANVTEVSKKDEIAEIMMDIENIESIENIKAIPEFVTEDLTERYDSVGKKFPQKIQLAAGMAIEVDGVLDLRNHTVEDARERLKDRVLDGVLLGWRTLHVILGNSESLNQALIDYINSHQSYPLTRYAQAPVPMGGTQAWVLYYGVQANKSENS